MIADGAFSCFLTAMEEVPVPGGLVELALVSSSKRGASRRFAEVEESATATSVVVVVEYSMSSWTGAGAVEITDLIVTFLRFSTEDARRAEEAGGVPPFFEDRG